MHGRSSFGRRLTLLCILQLSKDVRKTASVHKYKITVPENHPWELQASVKSGEMFSIVYST